MYIDEKSLFINVMVIKMNKESKETVIKQLNPIANDNLTNKFIDRSFNKYIDLAKNGVNILYYGGSYKRPIS